MEAADFLKMTFKLLEKMAQNTADQAANSSAIVLTLTERFPELEEAFQRNLATVRANSPFQKTTDQLIAQTRAVLGQALQEEEKKPGDPKQSE